MQEAITRIRRLREANKEYFNDIRRIRQDVFKVRDIVYAL